MGTNLIALKLLSKLFVLLLTMKLKNQLLFCNDFALHVLVAIKPRDKGLNALDWKILTDFKYANFPNSLLDV